MPLNIERRCSDFRHISDYVRVNSPKISDIAAAFQDHETAIVHICTYVTYFNNLLNTSDNDRKMNKMQIEDCARTLYQQSRLHELTVTELHEFFNRLKAGYYGEFFGSIDTLKICSGFRRYVGDLVSVRGAISRELAARRRVEAYESWIKVSSGPHKPIEDWFEDE